MAVTKDTISPDEGKYICGVCGQHVSIDNISFMDGSDYQFWATSAVCDDCIHKELK